MEVTDNPGGVAAASLTSTATLRRVSLFDQININVFWITNNFHWQALLAIVIPSMVVKYLGDANKDINLTLVVIWGTLIALLRSGEPVFGMMSQPFIRERFSGDGRRASYRGPAGERPHRSS